MKAGLLQFVLARGAGDATLRKLADWCAQERSTVDEFLALCPDVIASMLNIDMQVASNILAQREPAQRMADTLESDRITIAWIGDDNYPERLRHVMNTDAPPLLFIKGNISLLNEPAVGFCGSRKASEKGLSITADAARILAKSKVCIVSGYAHGVDLAAHRAALDVGGSTVFVIVEGILRFRLKKDIAEAITQDNHLVVSQFPPNLPWMARNAMKRNGTIIGLSDAMILVESGIDGGTFAAGTESLKRNQPLFVVDFAEPTSSSAGNALFIERGGVPIRGNRQGIPNVERVLGAIRSPRWREKSASTSLF